MELLNPLKYRGFQHMLLVGFFYSSLGMMLAAILFDGYASIASCFLTTIPLILVVHRIFSAEEKLDEVAARLKISEASLLRKHFRALEMFLGIFLGMVLTSASWQLLLPEDLRATLFSTQQASVEAVGKLTASVESLGEVLAHNLKILALCLLFSLLYGSGAIFLLVWNAFLLGFVIGDLLREALGTKTLAASIAFFVHGIPEVLAYFTASLAGGILSLAFVRRKPFSPEFKKAVLDSFALSCLAVLLLILAGVLEVFVTTKL